MQKAIIELPNGLKAEVEIKRFRAHIIYSPNAKGEIIIPKFIEYESKKYLVTSIEQESFRDNMNIKSISFPIDSCVRSIDIDAFSRSSISHFFIPASLETLNEMWCRSSGNLFQIEVSSENKNFTYVNDQFLFNKLCDVILFSRRDIQGNIIIPLNVKKIAPNAFAHCKRIKSIIFETTCLQSIDKFAFSNCQNLISIDAIPSSVDFIGCMCFYSCNFISMEFLGNSIFIDNECFDGCSNLSVISFPNSKNIKIANNPFTMANSSVSIFVQTNTNIKVMYFH